MLRAYLKTKESRIGRRCTVEKVQKKDIYKSVVNFLKETRETSTVEKGSWSQPVIDRCRENDRLKLSAYKSEAPRKNRKM